MPRGRKKKEVETIELKGKTTTSAPKQPKVEWEIKMRDGSSYCDVFKGGELLVSTPTMKKAKEFIENQGE